MDDKNFQDGINSIINILNKYHVEQFNWAQNLYLNQQYMKSVMGVREKNTSWTPYYDKDIVSDSREPEIYNKFGQKMRTCFLSSRKCANEPYKIFSNYIFFDRYNYGLKNHFYVEDEAFKTVGKPNKKFALLMESHSIVPSLYEMFLKNKQYLENNFDFVFTYDAEVLQTIKNARFAPLSSGIWYGKNVNNDQFKSENNLGGGVIGYFQIPCYRTKIINLKQKIFQWFLRVKGCVSYICFVKHLHLNVKTNI